jgi:dTDP-4-amino-4,6-dideoxygalactose transaminase
VALSSYLCSAPLDALALTGAEPVLIDADPATLAIDVTAVNREKNLDAVIAAHLFGYPAPVDQITCDRLIEDCAQTLGVSAGDRPVGAAGVVTVCSFYGTKLIAAGHGGLLAGNDPALERAAQELFTHDGQEEWRRPHLHYAMSDLAAALGLSQLGKIDRFIRERRAVAERYTEALGGSVIAPACAYSRFLVIAEDAEAMIASFRAAGIEAKRPVFRPLHLLLGRPPEEFPVATWAHEHIVSVPLYPGMAAEEIACVTSFLREHARALRCRPPA